MRINRTLAAMFLGFWLEAGLVEEVVPGRFRLTAEGEQVASGLLGVERDGVAA